MDLEELRAFVAVVETGSFLGAERVLNMPRATVRRRVDALEARAGVPLLNRSHQGITATEAGTVLAARGRQMIQEATALVASVREIGQEPSGVLRVLLPVGLPPHLMIPVFMALRSTYPLLSVHARMSEDPVGGLLDDIDVAVHFGSDAPPGPWVSHTFVRTTERLIAHADYLRAHGTPASLEDLGSHELFSWHAPGEDPRSLPLRIGGSFAVEPKLVTRDVHVIRQCVVAGLGIGLVPDPPLPDPGTSPGDIIPVLEEYVGRQRAVRVVVPSMLSDVPKIKAVLKHVRAFTEMLNGT